MTGRKIVNRETVDILQIKVDNITMTDAVTRVGEFIASRRDRLVIICINAM